MQNAFIVLVVSVLLLVGGRTLMVLDRRAKSEGLFACVVAVALTFSWYRYHPYDFEDLRYYAYHYFFRMASQDGGYPVVLVAAMPVAIGVILMIIVHRASQLRQPWSVRNWFGPLGRVRRPRVLR
jgi:hypothetical protein